MALWAVEDSFRTMWTAHKQPGGLETIQRRIGGAEAGCRAMSVRLQELLEGRIPGIPELHWKA